jgi:ribonuclease P/MRP protein subunit RPP1
MPQINPIPTPLPFPTPLGIRRVLTRCTVPVASGPASSKNPRLSDLRPHYDVIAVRPTDERALQHACTELETDVLSLDLARRYAFPFKHSIIGLAVRRGIAIELCYSAATAPGSEGGASSTQGASQAGASQVAANETEARRNAFTNAQALLRASRGGRGVIISSGARSVLGLRAPGDAVNLAIVWGMRPDAAADAVGEAARKTLAAARLRGKSFRGVVEVVYGGEKPAPVPKKLVVQEGPGKRKALEDGESPTVKKESKRAAKRAKKDGRRADGASGTEQPTEGGASETSKTAVGELSKS